MSEFTDIGVNLGGWLILEQWMTPSVFEGTDAVDEWGLSLTEEGKQKIQHHRDTFMTEEDFKWLKECGISLVRLPVPYWALEESAEYVYAGATLKRAMRMAEKYELKVLLDFHALPGGQNRGDHSGKKGQLSWFDDEKCQKRSIELLQQMAETYRDHPALWGIEIMNEPEVKGHYFQLIRFYRQAYKMLRATLCPGTYTVFHDGFQPLLFTGSLWPKKNYPVLMDVHWYGFPLTHTKKFQKYLIQSRRLRNVMKNIVTLWQPIIVGEWSSVLPQRFFDAVPNEQHNDLLAKNVAMQYNVYKRVAGNMYWNYKAEAGGMWNLRSLVDEGVIRLNNRGEHDTIK